MHSEFSKFNILDFSIFWLSNFWRYKTFSAFWTNMNFAALISFQNFWALCSVTFLGIYVIRPVWAVLGLISWTSYDSGCPRRVGWRCRKGNRRTLCYGNCFLDINLWILELSLEPCPCHERSTSQKTLQYMYREMYRYRWQSIRPL